MMGGLEGPPSPPNARQRPGKAVALLEFRFGSKLAPGRVIPGLCYTENA
jgi:hypothetical protein